MTEQTADGKEAPGSERLLLELGKVPTAVLSDVLDELGEAGAIPSVKAQRYDQPRVAGYALPVRFERKEADAAAYRFGGGVGRPLEEVLKNIKAGHMVVMDLGGTETASAWGGLASRLAQLRGARGTVLYGTCRDVEEIRHLGYPVWALGTYPRRSRNEFTFGAIGEALDIGGVVIEPDDVLVGDATGIVRIPRARAAEVLDMAKEIETSEVGLVAQIETSNVVDWDQL